MGFKNAAGVTRLETLLADACALSSSDVDCPETPMSNHAVLRALSPPVTS